MAEPNREDEGNRGVENEAGSGECADLQMSPEAMLDLARKAAELLVARTENLPEEGAWEGEFRRELADRLMKAPPEEGRPAVEVMEQVAKEILPISGRMDHPRCFGFIPSSPTWPSVLADFLAAGFNSNVCTWLVASGPSQLELVVIDWLRRWIGYPDGAGGLLTSAHSPCTRTSCRIRCGARTIRTSRTGACS